MSIQVRIPEEIDDYKESLIAGLSVRELISSAVALGCGLPTYFILSDFNSSLATILTMIIVVPAFCLGFIRPQGYKFEKYLQIRIAAEFVPSKRSYSIELNKEPVPIEVLKYRKLALDFRAEYEREEVDAHQGTKKAKRAKKHRYTEYNNSHKSTEKDFERKRKAALACVKAARTDYRRKKCQKEKTA